MSHAADPGFLAHIRSWFERDVEPDIADLKATAEKVRELAPQLQSLAGVVVLLVKVADPAVAPEVTAAVEVAVKAAEEVSRIAAELTASGM